MTSLGTSGRSELGRTSCSRVPRRWPACPGRRIPFFRRNRGGYCCTNARVERSFMLEGLAGQAASTGRRTGSCCCSCKSAISVGEAWWSGPIGLPQCLRLQTAPLHCTSASRQLRYTVPVPPGSSSLYQRLHTPPLHCLPVPPDSSATLSPGRCVTLLLPVLIAAPGFVGERGGE